MEFIGTSGDDDLAGTTGDDLFRMGKGGDDIVFGDAGRDILKFYGTLTAADRIDGGAGADAVRLDGEYTGANALVFTATTMVNVEGLTLAGRENSYDLTTVDATVTAGQTLRVSGDSLTSGHTLTFDGSAETDGHFRISDGAGDDVLTGGGQSDLFSLYKGGNDTVSGGIGADAFAMRGTFTADDRIAGGAGQDHIRLGGDYAGANALVFRASTMVGIERIGVHGAHDYDLTVVDANVAANAQLEVFGRDLQAGHTLKFDGSAETDGYFLLTGGGGDDVLIGGRLGDVFDLTQGGTDTVSGGNGDDIIRMGRTLRSNDSIDGGAGSDTLNLNGDYPNRIALGPTSIRNIETIFVAAHHSYELTLDNANVASGQLLTIDGSALDAGNTLIVHGAAETDGRFALIGGAGDDTLTGGARADTFDLSEGGDDTARGGAGNDTFDFGGAFTSGDNVDGGAGSNTLTMTGDANGALSDANVTHISKVILNGNGLSFLQVTGDITGGAGMLTVDASAATFGEADFTGATSSSYHFIGGDSPVGAYGVTIGANIHQSDIFDGGSGLHDGIVLEGDFSGGYTFGAQNLLHMETVLLQAGFGYVLTTVDANVASGTTLTVDGGDVLAADTFQFDGSAETNGHFNLVGSVGNDVLTGGGMSDTFDLTRGGDDTVQGGGGDDTINIGDKLTADDRIDGGTGTNTVVLSGFYADGAPPPAVFDEAMVTNISHVELVGSSSAALIGVIGDITGGAGTLTISGALSQSIFAALYQATSAGYNFLGSSGDDYIGFANNLHSTDVIDGGGSSDTLSLSGDYSAGYTFGAQNLLNIENVQVSAGAHLTTIDANVINGATLTVYTSAGVTASYWNGAAETDSHFNFVSTGGDNVLIGGLQSDNFDLANFSHDTVTGGGGADTFNLTDVDSGTDTFVFNAVSDSTGATYDTFTDMWLNISKFQISGFATVPAAIDTAVTIGTLSTGSFDTDLASAVGAAKLGANHAVLFTADGGGLSGETFLVVDVNGTAGYQSGQDLVIHLDGATGTLSTGNFI